MLSGFVGLLLILLVVEARGATIVVNLNAGPSSPNAGRNSGSYAYNPVTLSLGAGSYMVTVAGVSGGGLYDAYSVYADNGNNSAFTDAFWSVSLDGSSAAYTQANAGRTNTAAAAKALYGAASPYVFSLNAAQVVSFYVDDGAYPYFGDDSGGVSLAVAQIPEPGSLVLLGVGVLGTAFVFRGRSHGARWRGAG